MSKNKIREDKTCLNCNHEVENRFCPNCGQENIDTRKSFHHLFIHFFEDLTHYENAFWRTIKNLFLHPASLTKEYLSGKRMSYLAPVRLYIFISFVTFFMFSIFSGNTTESFLEKKKEKEKTEKQKYLVGDKKFGLSIKTHAKDTIAQKKDTLYKEQLEILKLEKSGVIEKKVSDSLQKFIVQAKEKNSVDENDFINLSEHYRDVAQLDSIQKFSKDADKLSSISYWFNRKFQLIKDKYKGRKEELKEKFIESFVHNIPKALFLYMPIFAFFLWLFHSKKKWCYFDHGIFTLHYFSFLLIQVLAIFLISHFLSLLNYSFFDILSKIISLIGIIWMIYYFYPAHHRFYGGKRRTSVFLGSFLFFLNFIFISLFMTVFIIYSFISIS